MMISSPGDFVVILLTGVLGCMWGLLRGYVQPLRQTPSLVVPSLSATLQLADRPLGGGHRGNCRAGRFGHGSLGLRRAMRCEEKVTLPQL